MIKNRFMPYFEADGAGGGADGGADDGQKDNKQAFDEILKNKEFQAEFDRRMTKGIETAIENERKRLEALVDDKLSEAEKMQKMTEAEKLAHEQQKKADEIAKREAAITRRELEAEAKNILAEKGLPASLAGVLDYSDADACKQSIATMEEAFNGAVKVGVEDKLKGGKPPRGAKHEEKDEEKELDEQIYNAMRGTKLVIK